MKNTLNIVLTVLVAVMLAACSNSEEDVSRDTCYFYFNLNNHPASIIRNSLTGINSFVRVHCAYKSTGTSGRVLHLYASMYGDKSEEDNAIELELRRPYVLGLYNLLYIGWSTGDNALMAYDGQCPVCYDETGLTRYPLQWSNSGLYLKCSNCGREYDLNNRGFAINNTGRLKRYIVSAAGGILLVHNAQ